LNDALQVYFKQWDRVRKQVSSGNAYKKGVLLQVVKKDDWMQSKKTKKKK
jgi:hypothetical protein